MTNLNGNDARTILAALIAKEKKNWREHRKDKCACGKMKEIHMAQCAHCDDSLE